LTTNLQRIADESLSASVESFLRANPGWLSERPELYRALTPPARFHGDPLADHMAAMLRIERNHAAEMAARADGVLAAGRAAAGLAQLVQQAVLSLIHALDPAECVSSELPAVLGIDAASLCVEDHLPHARVLPAGFVETALNGREIVFRTDPPDAALIHAEAARLAHRDALIRIPWRGAPALLALVSRDTQSLDPASGNALSFLGRVVGAALERMT